MVRRAWIVGGLSIAGAALVAGAAASKDFGVYGTLFPVTEPDFLQEIIGRFQTMEETGELKEMERAMQARTRAYIDRPTVGALLPPAEEYRAFEFDPSITLDRDLMDQNGTVFAKAGTRVNPLAYSGFSKRIVVIDGDEEAQVKFALSEGNEIDTLIVIAKGAPLDLSNNHGRRFWFDQQGVIVARFGLEYLPSVITRADPVMLIEEIPVEEVTE